MKIYTKTGDEGTTGLPGQPAGSQGRPPHRGLRDDRRAERRALGLARAQGLDPAADVLVGQLQDELFAVGSALADPDPNGQYHNAITAEHATRLEKMIDELETGARATDELHSSRRIRCRPRSIHLARTVCRRAERLVVRLARQPEPACQVP